MQIPAGALQSVMTKSRQEIPRKYESVSFFHKLLTRPAFPGCTPLLGVEMAVLVVHGRARTRKNKVLNTYYLSYQTSKFLYDRSLHLFFRRGQCSWLGNSNIEEHHLEKCEGDISSHVSIAPSLELARTSVPFILLLFELKHAKLIPHSEPFACCPLCVRSSLSRSLTKYLLTSQVFILGGPSQGGFPSTLPPSAFLL